MPIVEPLRLPSATAIRCRAPIRRAGPTWASVALASAWLAIAPAFGQSGATGDTGGPFGRWLTDNGNLEVEIAPCGPAVCGTVTKILANRSMSGSGEMAAVDTRSPLGMVILKDFISSGDGEWRGEIYNRENAKTYSCKISLGGPDQLIVRPYVGMPLFGKTLVWKRVATQTGQK